MGLGGNRVVEAKEDKIQLGTLTSGAKYSVLKYTEASTEQIYKIIVAGVLNNYLPCFISGLRMYSTENSTCSR